MLAEECTAGDEKVQDANTEVSSNDVPQIFIAVNTKSHTKHNSDCVDKSVVEVVHSDDNQLQSRAQCEPGPGLLEGPAKVELDVERHTMYVWKGVKDCFTHSSFHGLPFLANSLKAKIRLVFWITLILTAIILMLYSLSAVTTRFASVSLYTSTSRHFPKQLPFPAITMCNFNPLRATAVFYSSLSLDGADLFLTYALAKNNVSIPTADLNSFVQQYDRISQWRKE